MLAATTVEIIWCFTNQALRVVYLYLVLDNTPPWRKCLGNYQDIVIITDLLVKALSFHFFNTMLYLDYRTMMLVVKVELILHILNSTGSVKKS